MLLGGEERFCSDIGHSEGEESESAVEHVRDRGEVIILIVPST